MLLFLANAPIYLRDGARHVYVEIVMHGNTEGKFLEDSEAHSWETLGEVSRLGGFWQCVAKPIEKLTAPLIKISSLLDECRHRSWGGGHHQDITGRLAKGGLSGGGCYVLPASRFSEESSG